MQYLFLIFTLILSAQSFGQTSADQSQMIKDGCSSLALSNPS